jgi:hypothetical protein
MLRHSSRHLAKTVIDRITDHVVGLGWTTAPPFGTTPVEIVTRRFRESELQALTGNKLGLMFSDETDDEPAELGGGLLQNRTTLYADVIAVNDGVGLALASDIKDLLTGKVIGQPRMFKMRDYTTNPAGDPLDEWVVEFLDVRRQRPSQDLRAQFWQVVTADVELTFPGEE